MTSIARLHPALFRLASNILRSTLAGVIGALILTGCADEPTKVETPTGPLRTTIAGRIVDAEDANRGIPDVLVRAVGKTSAAATDSTGQFVLEVNVVAGEIVQLAISKAGFGDVVTSLTVQSGQLNRLPSAISLTRSGNSGGTGTGPASSVALKSISAPSIGVVHSGGDETALLRFEVRDGEGRPVDFDHRATLQFSLTQRLDGGAFLTVDTASTDPLGVATVALNSGTLAQAVQIRAHVTGTNLFSDLVRVAIHGGLPHAQHFSFAPEVVNVQGLREFGIEVPVTAFVGDRYGNPVPEGTVVYFSTTGGIIQGSAATDDHGRATVDLITAEPLPNNVPAVSDTAGIARISIQTMDENRAPIVQSGLAVMFSGHTDLEVSPQTFDIPLNGAQVFTVTVRDVEHRNPLAGGSTITFTTTLGTVGGEVTAVIPDTQDKDFTDFEFRLENNITGPALVGPNRARMLLKPIADLNGTQRGDEAAAGRVAAFGSAPTGPVTNAPATVTVRVTSPNGNAREAVFGTIARP